MASIHPAFSAIITIALLFSQLLPASTDDRNLFEFSIVSYGDGSRFPSPGPPRLRVYNSGRFIVYEDDRYVEGLLTSAEISQLRTQLSRSPHLSRSQAVEVSRGEPIMMHGGFALIRYLDGESQVVLVSEKVPNRGPMADLIQSVRSFRPRRVQPFSRDTVMVSVTDVSSLPFPSATCPAAPPPNLIWQFEDRVPLQSLLRNPTSLDSELSRSLFDQMYRTKTGLGRFDYCQNGSLYWLFIVGVPGWYGDGIQLAAGFDAQALLDESKKAHDR